MATAKNAARTTAKKTQDIENETVLVKAQTIDIPTVVKDMGDLQVQIQASLASLSAALTAKVQTLGEINTAVALTETRLSELHSIERELLNLESIKARRASEEEDAQVERDRRSAEWAEEDAEREKEWTREEESHEYTMKVQRQREQDDFDAEVSRQRRAEDVRRENLEKDWADREAKLKAQENEVQILRDQVAGFDAKVKAEVSKAEAIVGRTMKSQHDHELALIKKDAETSEKLHLGQVSSFVQTIDQLRNQVGELQTQLAAARADAKDVATQALQSASGRQVADALQRVVDTGNNGNKGGK